MSGLGKISNQLSGNGGKGGGMGSECLSGPAVFVDERPTFWLNPHEASSRRGQARNSSDGPSRGTNKMEGI